jgi:HSP20 family protein
MCKVNSVLYGQRTLSSPIISRPATTGEAHWVPNTDVYIADGKLVIQVELAGMRRSDLELMVEGNRLMICGQRPDGSRAPKCKFLVMEINYGPFECVFEIPKDFDLNQAKAAYQNGFLRIDVPQLARAPSKLTRVPISEE